MIDLDPVWNPGGGRVAVRFGGIDNFHEVSGFFSRIARPNVSDKYLDQVIGMRPGETLGSEGLKRVILELDHNGVVEIHCRSVTTR